MKTALRPNSLNLDSYLKEKKVEGKVTDEERSLYTLSESSGWRVLTGFINELLLGLDQVNSSAISAGAPFDEIGRNTVVINMSKEVINRILTKVSDAREACEKANEQ